jgi:hypothetical protein
VAPTCWNGRQDVLGQFSMVSMELFNIVEDIKNVSKVFVVYPRNVNAENATSKLFWKVTLFLPLCTMHVLCNH